MTDFCTFRQAEARECERSVARNIESVQAALPGAKHKRSGLFVSVDTERLCFASKLRA